MRVNQRVAERARGMRRALRSRRAWVILLGTIASGTLACAMRRRDVPASAATGVREYLGDAGRAATAGESLAAEPRQLWRRSAGRGTLGAVAIGDSVAVIASVDRWLSALDLRDGRPYWRVRVEASPGAGVVIGGGRVIVPEQGPGGRVAAYRLRDGKRGWRRSVGEVATPLVLDRGSVYGVTRGGLAFALRESDGRPRWQRAVGAGSRSGVILAGRLLALVTVADTLVVLDAATGRIETRRGLTVGVAAPLARIDDSTLAIASPAGTLAAVGLPRGDMRWRVDTGAPVFGAPAVVGDTVFALTNQCTFWAVAAHAPTSPDTLAAPAPPAGGAPCTTVSAPAVVRGGVLVATVGGALHYLDRRNRRVAWTLRAPGELRHPPAIRHGQIVVAPLIGDVVSFR